MTTYTIVMHYSNPPEGSGLPLKPPLSITIPSCLGGLYTHNVDMAQKAYSDAVIDMMLDDNSIEQVQLWRNDHLLSAVRQ